MGESIQVSSEFRETLEAHRREGETLEETLRRLIGGPSPDVLAELVGDGESDELRTALKERRDAGRDRRDELRERFE
jgi:hypothetical protein